MARYPRRPSLALLGLILLTALLAGAAPAGASVSGTFGSQDREQPPFSLEPLQYHGGPVLHSTDAFVVYWDPEEAYRGDWERLIDKYFQDVAAESGSLDDIFALDTQYRDVFGAAANQSTFHGSFKDTNPYPTTVGGGKCSEPAGIVCLTSVAVEKELKQVVSSEDPPLPGETGTPVYYLLTPPGVTICTGSGAGSDGTCSNSAQLESEAGATPATTGICGYHSYLSAPATPYVVQPWIAGFAGEIEKEKPTVTTFDTTSDVLACQDNSSLQEPNQLAGRNPFGGDYREGLADVIVNDLSIEQMDTMVDPFLNGWYQTATKAEQSDVCQFVFGGTEEGGAGGSRNALTHAGALADQTINGDSYYLQYAWNSSAATNGEFLCDPGVSLEPYFTAPSPVDTEDYVGFNGTESLITFDANQKVLTAEEPYIAPEYKWNFGDGTTAAGIAAASQFHRYEYAGTYDVTLTVKDGGENVRSTTHEVVVTGKQRPASVGPGSSSPASAGSTSSSSGTRKPVANALAPAQTLRGALGKGLLVRYSVNEQVTGRFEVLLPASVGKRVGLHGRAVTGLPKGTPPQIMIGKAILNATRGGHSQLRIKFGKVTAKRLRRLSKTTLMVRLIVRNSAAQSSISLSTVNLRR